MSLVIKVDIISDITILWFFIIFLGALVQGVTGFGFALTVTPLMVSFVDTNKLIVMVLALSFFLSGLMSCKLKRHADYGLIKYLIVSSIVGAFLGAYLLNIWGTQDLPKLIIAVFVIVFSVLIHFDISKPIKNEGLGGIVAGFFSGTFSTLTSFGGPPVVLLLSNQKKLPLSFKGTISLYFLLKSLFSILILVVVTNVSPGIVIISLIFIPVIFLGWKAGNKIASYVSERHFRLGVLIIIIAAALRIIFDFFAVS